MVDCTGTAQLFRASSKGGVKLERGGLHAKKIGDVDAFGCDERTPSLPHAAKEDPRVELHPTLR
jgi:hypothetical protein